MGGDKETALEAANASVFQSTPPHGGRHNSMNQAGNALGFNPRPRMGGDKPLAR